MHRRKRRALVNFDQDGNPVQVEVTYVDELTEGSRTFKEQKTESESFETLPDQHQMETVNWLAEVVDKLMERRDPFDGSIPAHLIQEEVQEPEPEEG